MEHSTSAASKRRCQLVGNSLVVVGDFRYRHPRDRAEVEGLSTGDGIEGGAIEIDGASFVGAIGDSGVESAEVRVSVIEAFRHGKTHCDRWQVYEYLP